MRRRTGTRPPDSAPRIVTPAVMAAIATAGSASATWRHSGYRKILIVFSIP